MPLPICGIGKILSDSISRFHYHVIEGKRDVIWDKNSKNDLKLPRVHVKSCRIVTEILQYEICESGYL